MKYYKCNTCDALVTEFGKRNHKHKTFTQVVGDELAEKIFTRTSQKEEPNELELLVKKPVYINKTGKIVMTRRRGSRVSIQYGKHDQISKSIVPMEMEDFYRIMFSKGMVDEKYLHTFSYAYGEDNRRTRLEFLGKLLSLQTAAGSFAIAFNHNGMMHFAYNIYESRDIGLLLDPCHTISGQRTAPYISREEREVMREIGSEMIYGDMLSPRDGYLTTILLTLLCTDGVTRKYVVFEVRDNIEVGEIDERCGVHYEEMCRIAKEVLIG